MQAAIGCSQLKKLPSFIETRNKNAKILTEMIKKKIPNHEDLMILPKTNHSGSYGLLVWFPHYSKKWQ